MYNTLYGFDILHFLPSIWTDRLKETVQTQINHCIICLKQLNPKTETMVYSLFKYISIKAFLFQHVNRLCNLTKTVSVRITYKTYQEVVL